MAATIFMHIAPNAIDGSGGKTFFQAYMREEISAGSKSSSGLSDDHTPFMIAENDVRLRQTRNLLQCGICSRAE